MFNTIVNKIATEMETAADVGQDLARTVAPVPPVERVGSGDRVDHEDDPEMKSEMLGILASTECRDFVATYGVPALHVERYVALCMSGVSALAFADAMGVAAHYSHVGNRVSMLCAIEMLEEIAHRDDEFSEEEMIAINGVLGDLRYVRDNPRAEDAARCGIFVTIGRLYDLVFGGFTVDEILKADDKNFAHC